MMSLVRILISLSHYDLHPVAEPEYLGNPLRYRDLVEVSYADWQSDYNLLADLDTWTPWLREAL